MNWLKCNPGKASTGHYTTLLYINSGLPQLNCQTWLWCSEVVFWPWDSSDQIRFWQLSCHLHTVCLKNRQQREGFNVWAFSSELFFFSISHSVRWRIFFYQVHMTNSDSTTSTEQVFDKKLKKIKKRKTEITQIFFFLYKCLFWNITRNKWLNKWFWLLCKRLFFNTSIQFLWKPKRKIIQYI